MNEAREAVQEEKKAEEAVDFTTMSPQGVQVQKVVDEAVVFSDKEKKRSGKATDAWLRLIERSQGRNPQRNEAVVLAARRRDFAEVQRLWGESYTWGYPISPDAYNSFILGMTRLEDEGVYVDVEKVFADYQASGVRLTTITHFAMVEYYTKRHAWHEARRSLRSLSLFLNRRYEDLQELADQHEENGEEIPQNLLGPHFNIAAHSGFASLDQIKLSLAYYFLVISEMDGTAGPLSRRRTLDALFQHWNNTELGALSPFDNVEAFLSDERKTITSFETM